MGYQSLPDNEGNRTEFESVWNDKSKLLFCFWGDEDSFPDTFFTDIEDSRQNNPGVRRTVWIKDKSLLTDAERQILPVDNNEYTACAITTDSNFNRKCCAELTTDQISFYVDIQDAFSTAETDLNK
ncbi:MAG: hypothetical protein FH748_06985 [Balneolaceae bacterium]|nr:hypothetical protein [Balneolaceae bacterium]